MTSERKTQTTEKKTTQPPDLQESSPNLYQRIVGIMDFMGAVGKGGKTSYGDRYEYHRIDDIDDKLRQALIAHGVVATITKISNRELRSFEALDKNGKPRTTWHAECSISITLVNADAPDEQIVLRGWGQGIDFSDKATGKAISYAAKSAYLSAFHLRGQPDNEKGTEAKVSASQLNGLKIRFAESHKDELKGKDRAAKAASFNHWAREIIGEEVDYRTAKVWEPDWMKACWQDLTVLHPTCPSRSSGMVAEQIYVLVSVVETKNPSDLLVELVASGTYDDMRTLFEETEYTTYDGPGRVIDSHVTVCRREKWNAVCEQFGLVPNGEDDDSDA